MKGMGLNRRRRCVWHCILIGIVGVLAGRAAQAAPYPMTFNGGPIVNAPSIFLVFWGKAGTSQAFTSPEMAVARSWVKGFAQFVSGNGVSWPWDQSMAGQEPTLRQYGIWGATYAGDYNDTSSSPPANVYNRTTGNSVALNEITALQLFGLAPAFNQRMFILVVTKNPVTNPSGCGSFHSMANAGQYFGVASYTDCGMTPPPSFAFAGCTYSPPSQPCNEQWFETRAAREIADMATDPTGSGWVYWEGGEVNDCSAHSCTDACPDCGLTDEVTFPNAIRGQVPHILDNLGQTSSSVTRQQYSQTSVTSWGTNRMDAFSLNADHSMSQISFTGSAWTSWQPHGGNLMGPPAVSSWGTNELDVFAQGTDSAYYLQHWNGSTWQPSMTGWENHGGAFVGPPAVVSWGGNRVDAFGQQADGTCGHQYYDGSSWRPSATTWESLGGSLVGPPAVVSYDVGRLALAAEGTNGAYFLRTWNVQTTQWSPANDWEPHGTPPGAGFAGPPVLVSWGPNDLSIFGRSTTGHIFLQHWNGTAWSNWEDHGGNAVGQPAVVSWAPGVLELYVQQGDGNFYRQQYNGAAWLPSVTGWEAHGGNLASAPAMSQWGNGNFAAFGTSTDGTVLDVQAWQGSWSPGQTSWTSLYGYLGQQRVCGGSQHTSCSTGGEFCELASGACATVNPTGFCLAKATTCDDTIIAPVCGCDGKSYANDCERQAAGVPKWFDGRCFSPSCPPTPPAPLTSCTPENMSCVYSLAPAQPDCVERLQCLSGQWSAPVQICGYD